MTFYFNKQNQVGNEGEQFVIDNYPGRLIKSDNYVHDLLDVDTNHLVEIKTDTYHMSKTDNFFIETIGNDKKQTLGGPFRSKKDNINIFIYLFIKDRTWYQFNDVSLLVDRCNQLIDSGQYKVKKIRNPSYMTLGYCLPRDLFKDLYVKYVIPEKTEEK